MNQLFTVYVLYSANFDKVYIGYTSNLINRFHSHNSLSTKVYTLKFRPWMVAYTEVYDSKSEAMQREKQLKSGQGRVFIWNYIEKHKSKW